MRGREGGGRDYSEGARVGNGGEIEFSERGRDRIWGGKDDNEREVVVNEEK